MTARLPDDAGERQFVTDMIMSNSYSAESFEMSLSRLAYAAWRNGFTVLSPSVVIGCYLVCNELSEKRYEEGSTTVWSRKDAEERSNFMEREGILI